MIGGVIVSTGAVASVGLSAPAVLAACRGGLVNNTESRFIDSSGDWITVAEAPMEQPWRGRAKILHMSASVIEECLAGGPEISPDRIALLLCTAEVDRPGRLQGLDDSLLEDISTMLGREFHQQSRVFKEGSVGGVNALLHAGELLENGHVSACIVAGGDTYLTADTLRLLDKEQRLLSETNSNGFIPGEAAAGIMLSAPDLAPTGHSSITIEGIGLGSEPSAADPDLPLRADGMTSAARKALDQAGMGLHECEAIYSDVAGEQNAFREIALMQLRLLRVRRQVQDIKHPAENLGEIGAAHVPMCLAVFRDALMKGYADGPTALALFSNDSGPRAAMVLTAGS
jgi:3-oxoacyl-[acyl-carrier-protein] synthase-1